jgi:CysZ protein
MSALIPSATRAISSLFAPGMLPVMVKCVIVTIVALFLFVIGASSFFIWLAGTIESADFSLLVGIGGSIGSGILAWFLFPTIMPVIVNFFGERIAEIIEARDYPAVRPIQDVAFWREFLHDARFTLMTIGLNLLVLPLYLLPVLNIFLFYLLNGYLLGREFFIMVARRHVPVSQAEILRKRYSRTVMTAGILLTVMATIPILNLFAPFWGIAVMTHLYHRLTKVT